MHVRKATLEDLPRFVTLGKVMHAESSVYRNFDFDEFVTYDYFSVLIEHEDSIVLTLEKDGEVIGGFAGVVAKTWFGKDKWSTDLALFIHPEHRGARAAILILKAYINEARERGVAQISVSNSTGFEQEKVADLFASVGFQKVGYVLSMPTPQGEQ